MQASGNGPLNLREWQKWIDWCVTNKVSLITWSIADKDETCSMLKPVLPAKETGKMQTSRTRASRPANCLRKPSNNLTTYENAK